MCAAAYNYYIRGKLVQLFKSAPVKIHIPGSRGSRFFTRSQTYYSAWWWNSVFLQSNNVYLDGLSEDKHFQKKKKTCDHCVVLDFRFHPCPPVPLKSFRLFQSFESATLQRWPDESSSLRIVGYFFFYSEVFLYTVASILFISAYDLILELDVLNKLCLLMFTEKSGNGNGHHKE